MPSTQSDMPQLLAELMRILERPALDQTGAASVALEPQLQAGLAWLRRQKPDNGNQIAELIGCLLVRLAQDRLGCRIARQSAQFELQTLRQSLAKPDTHNRLSGDAYALGMLLAQLLPDMPASLRAVAFSPTEYLALNPDVAIAGLDPMDHYLSSGAIEGRLPCRLNAELSESGHSAVLNSLSAFAASSSAPCFCRDMPDLLRNTALTLLDQERPSVTVILPTWNRAHTVLSAVTSALLQSFAPTEVIVIDDGSTDATLNLLHHRFPEPLQDGRLMVIRQVNSGVSAARNAGLERAQGDFIAYLDSDNYWESDHLLYALAGALSVPDAQCAYTALCRHNLSYGWSDILFRPYDRAALSEANYIDLNSFVHRRQLYETHGGFDTALTRLVDWDLVLRYTADTDPVALPVITGHHVIDSVGLDNITTRESLEHNLAYIRTKQSIS